MLNKEKYIYKESFFLGNSCLSKWGSTKVFNYLQSNTFHNKTKYQCP